MMQILSVLIQFVFKALKDFLGFLAIFLLGIAGAALYVLPWLLRALSVFIWLASAFVGIQTIQTLYSPTTAVIPLFSLKFAVILLMVAWATYALKEGIQIWGALAAGGLVVWSFSRSALWLYARWEYANLFFPILPTLLFIVGTFFLAARLRMKRNPAQFEAVETGRA